MLVSGSRAKGLAGLMGFLFLASVVYVKYSETLTQYVLENTKVGNGLVDTNRLGIINAYLEKIDAITVWTGASYVGTTIADEYNGNPHNSFIRAHFVFGLPYLLLVLVLPAYLLHSKQPRSVKVYSACMWVVLLFRAFSEPIIFPTLLDFYYFALCFALRSVEIPNLITSPNLPQHDSEALARE